MKKMILAMSVAVTAASTAAADGVPGFIEGGSASDGRGEVIGRRSLDVR